MCSLRYFISQKTYLSAYFHALYSDYRAQLYNYTAIWYLAQWDFFLEKWFFHCSLKFYLISMPSKLHFRLLLIYRPWKYLSGALYEEIYKRSKLKVVATNFTYLFSLWLGVTTFISSVGYRVFFLYNKSKKYLLFIYFYFKTVFIAILVSFFFLNYMLYFFKINFLKQTAIWFITGFFFFWLMSGFNFFLKRYRLGKFTGAIQRFWKRTNMCFWLIEGFLFLIFFYYYTNSSQEPTYMYDYSSLNNEFLFSLVVYYSNTLILVSVIFILYIFLLLLSGLVYEQQLFFICCVTSLIFYIFFIESYQFYYVLGAFREFIWVFQAEEQLWGLEFESSKLRVKQQYLLMCLIAKYWHFLFIFISWIFFIMKSFEIKHVTFTLLGVNIQNFIILFGLNVLFISGWIKWLFRRYADLVYFWFFVNTNFRWTYYLYEEISWIASCFLS